MMTMITCPVEAGFQAGQPAAVADTALKSALFEMEAAKHRAVLWFADIMKRRLFRNLGYSNLPQYAEAELKLSKTRTGDFMRIATKQKIGGSRPRPPPMPDPGLRQQPVSGSTSHQAQVAGRRKRIG
jgi:hypothetical protein